MYHQPYPSNETFNPSPIQLHLEKYQAFLSFVTKNWLYISFGLNKFNKQRNHNELIIKGKDYAGWLGRQYH